MNHSKSKVIVSCVHNYSLDDVHALFKKIASNTSTSDNELKSIVSNYPSNFFLSALWISNWLKFSDIQPKLYTFTKNTLLKGFVFVGETSSLLGTTYYVNQTGIEKFDQIWIENNGIMQADHSKELTQALLEKLSENKRSFKLVIINSDIEISQHPKWRKWSVDKIPGYIANTSNVSVDKLLSKNSRGQHNRAKNYIQKKYGEICFNTVTQKEAIASLEKMKALHIRQWGTHKHGSGFSNESFLSFHKALIDESLNDMCFILHFKAGDVELGYLYFFAQADRILFYLSAINYCDASNKFKPGIVMHKQAIEYFSNLGFKQYDFLAGEARYKSTLSNQKYYLYNVHLYLNKWYYRPIKGLTIIKRWCQRFLQ